MRELLQLIFIAPAVGLLARSRTFLLPELALTLNTLLLASHLL